jgi:hypothetical protein
VGNKESKSHFESSLGWYRLGEETIQEVRKYGIHQYTLWGSAGTRVIRVAKAKITLMFCLLCSSLDAASRFAREGLSLVGTVGAGKVAPSL